MPIYVYFAHPLRGETVDATQANRHAAAVLVAKITAEYAGQLVPVAPWIHLAEVWSEAEGRELGLKIDCAAIERCNELWLIGPRVTTTPGMQIELDHARKHGLAVSDMRGRF